MIATDLMARYLCSDVIGIIRNYVMPCKTRIPLGVLLGGIESFGDMRKTANRTRREAVREKMYHLFDGINTLTGWYNTVIVFLNYYVERSIRRRATRAKPRKFILNKHLAQAIVKTNQHEMCMYMKKFAMDHPVYVVSNSLGHDRNYCGL